MKVDFGDFSFMRIEPKVVRFVSGVATAFLGSGGCFILLIYTVLCKSSLYDFAFSLKSPFFLEFNKEEYQAAKVDPIAQFAKPVTVYVNHIISSTDISRCILKTQF